MRPNLLFIAVLSSVSVTSQAAAIPRQEGPYTCRKTKAAVLGGGIAGITAAQTLSSELIDDFVIIEHNDYIGGHVRHTSFGESPDGSPYTVELGANWIEGAGNTDGPVNPILSLAERHDIKYTLSNYEDIITFDHTGRDDFLSLVAEFDGNYTIASQDAGYILSDNLQDTSVRAGLSVAGWKPKRDMRAQAVEWMGWDFGTAYSPDESGFQFGILGGNETFNRFGDDRFLSVEQRGLNSLVRGEADLFLEENDERLLLNTTVVDIEYGKDGVVVHTKSGECIQAEYAICTFSVGVLQNDAVRFEPQLPKWKREAIEQFQMGTYTKIFMQFNESFWPDSQYFLYADPDERGYYPVFQNYNAAGFLEGSNILFATVVGHVAQRVEQQGEEKTKAELLAVLRRMFPEEDIPEPTAFMFPKWGLQE